MRGGTAQRCLQLDATHGPHGGTRAASHWETPISRPLETAQLGAWDVWATPHWRLESCPHSASVSLWGSGLALLRLYFLKRERKPSLPTLPHPGWPWHKGLSGSGKSREAGGQSRKQRWPLLPGRGPRPTPPLLLATGEGPADPKAQLGPPTSALSPIYGLAYRHQKWKNFEKNIPLGDFPSARLLVWPTDCISPVCPTGTSPWSPEPLLSYPGDPRGLLERELSLHALGAWKRTRPDEVLNIMPGAGANEWTHPRGRSSCCRLALVSVPGPPAPSLTWITMSFLTILLCFCEELLAWLSPRPG